MNEKGREMNEMANLCLVTTLCCFGIVGVRRDAVAQSPPDLGRARQVSQHGVTWKFDRDVPVGQFVNGDYYVVGPVTVVGIDPAPVDGMNGSVLNLNPGRGKSGFDFRASRGNSYDARMRSAPPISMKPGDSLLSSVSAGKERQFPQMLWPFKPAL